MSAKNWTAGPWLLTENSTVYALGANECNSFWATLQTAGKDRIPDAEVEANAALMAAAPDLYDALEYALPYLQACVPDPRDGANGDINCVKRAMIAMAKARGEK